MSENPNPPEMRKPPTLLEEENEKKNKRRDFWIGMIGSIVLNLLPGGVVFIALVFLGILDTGSGQTTVSIIGPSLMYILPWVLNIVAIIFVLVIHRPAIALGILASYALAFVLSLIAGLIFMVVCFVQSGGI